jgi:glycerol-3-phosphate dehydrogenase (NAD(P)+)
VATIAVIGAGSWGTALAKTFAESGHDVTLWAHGAAAAQAIASRRENTLYLPGFVLPTALRVTNQLSEAVRGREVLLSVSPSHVVREVMTEALRHVEGSPYLVTASKGIEEGTLLTMAGVLEELAGPGSGSRVAALSGPSFAREVARGIPTAVTVAARERTVSTALQAMFNTPAFRVYSSEDLPGVEIGGAVKNVIAVAAGVSDGLGFGLNTRAALITRGIAETARLGMAMHADPLTLSGLAGLGDLVLTCTGDLSRNRTVGLRLGRGETLADILADMKMVAEGVKNTRTVRALASKMGVEMPITEQMYAMLYEQKPPRQVVSELMGRGPKPEFSRPG